MENQIEKKEKKRITVYLEKNTLERLKIEAIKKEVSVSYLVEKMTEELLSREK